MAAGRVAMPHDPDAPPGAPQPGGERSTVRSAAAAPPTPRRTQPVALARGAILAGRYCIAALLGRGGMGEVYRALDRELEVEVALKVLRLDLLGRPVALRRFKQEVLLARTVTHRNVCRVYDLGLHRRARRVLPFLTMELLAGETLRQRIVARGRLPVAEALALARQMAAGLDAAHRAGVIHRDFKSSNVILVADGAGERAAC
jgi:serine/threonine-protein kinase